MFLGTTIPKGVTDHKETDPEFSTEVDKSIQRAEEDKRKLLVEYQTLFDFWHGLKVRKKLFVLRALNHSCLILIKMPGRYENWKSCDLVFEVRAPLPYPTSFLIPCPLVPC